MNAIITYQLNKAAAIALFEENAVYHYSGDGIDIHRIGELLGEAAVLFYARTARIDGFMAAGKDWNASGACGDDPCLPYCYLSGWLKIVADHNHRLQVAAHQSSEAGAIYDRVLAERIAAIDAADAKNERKRREHTAKRAAPLSDV